MNLVSFNNIKTKMIFNYLIVGKSKNQFWIDTVCLNLMF